MSLLYLNNLDDAMNTVPEKNAITMFDAMFNYHSAFRENERERERERERV